MGLRSRPKKNSFARPPALPVTDLIVNPVDGALYFLIGGRRIQSGLYRVTYDGDESTAPAQYPAPTKQATVRKALEQGHGKDGSGQLAKIWPKLQSSDRFIRYAARTAP